MPGYLKNVPKKGFACRTFRYFERHSFENVSVISMKSTDSLRTCGTFSNKPDTHTLETGNDVKAHRRKCRTIRPAVTAGKREHILYT
jgi:hypothetical protein